MADNIEDFLAEEATKKQTEEKKPEPETVKEPVKEESVEETVKPAEEGAKAPEEQQAPKTEEKIEEKEEKGKEAAEPAKEKSEFEYLPIGSATLQITSAVLIFEFNVKANFVSLVQLQNCPNNTLKDIIGRYFKLHYLIKLMKDAGIDIFPTYDTFCYVEGISEKQSQMEMHCYRSMAQIYNSFNFTWSRWNVAQGRRCIVMQMREYTPNKYKQKNFSMVLVTVLKSCFIECTEVSPNFSEEEPEGLKFCADLYQLMKATSNISTRTVVQNGDKQCIYTLRRLLMATRVHSFSS